MSTKQVFIVKLQANSIVEQFKARLVVRGFLQVYREDYTKTFALTVYIDTLQIFLAIVAAKDLECHQYNIKNIFTKSKLQEKIYLSKLEGVLVCPRYVLQTLQSLYSLKQSIRDQNLLAKKFLISISFQQSLANLYLFTYTKRRIILLLYIDNIAAATKSSLELDQFYLQLSV